MEACKSADQNKFKILEWLKESNYHVMNVENNLLERIDDIMIYKAPKPTWFSVFKIKIKN